MNERKLRLLMAILVCIALIALITGVVTDKKIYWLGAYLSSSIGILIAFIYKESDRD